MPRSEQDAERDRLYHRGALAQSYAPRGLERDFNPRWKDMPRRKKRLLIVLYGIDVALVSAGGWAIGTGRTWLILGLAGAVVIPGVLGAIVCVPYLIVSERRKQRRRSTRQK